MKLINKLLILCASLPLSLGTASAAQVVVGGKNFTEQLLLAELTTQLLTAKGHTVKKNDGLGSQVVRDAQVNGQVDVYWEYVGTSLVTYNKVTDRLDRQAAYERVKELDAKQGLTWLEPSQADNTYALAVLNGNEKTADIKTLSDLAASYNDGGKLLMAVNAEFPGRADGLPGLRKAYDFKTSRAVLRPMDSGLTYQALRDGQVDVALVFATDGRIQAFDFRVLEDDKQFFPSYALAPVVRTAVLESAPELAEPLNAMAAKLDSSIMRTLNARVDVDKTPIEQVAKEFLTENGLI